MSEIRVQRSIDQFNRTRLGKEETVSEHTRTYYIKPELAKETKEKIKTGKAKRIPTQEETIKKFKDKTKRKKKSEQTNLDKELMINTKLVEKYGELKSFDKSQQRLTEKPSKSKEKPKLAFGFGYDPEQLREGITEVKYSHTLEDGTKLYTFKPKLPYRIFKQLAEEIGYETKGNILIKGNTEIKNHDFVTDKDHKLIQKELNHAIEQIYKKYEPVPVDKEFQKRLGTKERDNKRSK